jgi:hypothetical protein
MSFFLQDFLIEIAIHAGAVLLSKFTLHITIAKCAGYDPASPSSLVAIMNTIKPALRDSRTNHITGFINIWPIAAFFIFPTVEPSSHFFLTCYIYDQ